MSWYQITHKETGEKQIVASLNGRDEDDWEAIPIPRAPTEFEDIVDGRLVLNTERRDRVLEEARLAQLGSVGRYKEAIRKAKLELIAELQTEGVLSPQQAARIRTRSN